MKILIFYTHNQGYLSGFFKEISSRLSSEEHQVFNFSFKGKKDSAEFDGVKLFIEKKSGYINNYLHVYRIIKKIKPDVIISNFSYVNPALFFGKFFGVKNNLAWSHSLNVQMESSKSNILIKRYFLKLADIVIANSILTEKELHTSYALAESKTKVIPFWTNIIENKGKLMTGNFGNQSKAVKIGCPGRLKHHKNQQVVIKALSRIMNNGQDNFILYIVGNGETIKELKELVCKSNLDYKVKFISNLSVDEMIDFYKSMDVIVLPSLHEAFGLVLIETLALGTPVLVSSRFGALSFIHEDKNNLLSEITFNPNSVDSLTQKLALYFKGTPIKKEYIRELYLENFNKENIYSDLKKIILR
ncbi:glycosyltransferase family 4 protein [Hyunsoonleella aestuarii]|uniref:Glycosyltransferase family 4 protein n=1 Tax=Hyunsoonleella aestuarii TaxID=912802 RepID=A0ABP8E6W1_9FLAO|nr:glycosyltransferase family 4 protein [Hyunsoonleella aestuarii]